MAIYKVRLSIGYPGAVHEDEVEIDDGDLAECQTDEERNVLIDEAVAQWAWNFIEISVEPLD